MGLGRKDRSDLNVVTGVVHSTCDGIEPHTERKVRVANSFSA